MNFAVFTLVFLIPLLVTGSFFRGVKFRSFRKLVLHNSVPRIVGGTRTSIEQYPFMVSVQRGLNHYCGGTLLSTSVVLTAAHCAYNQEVYKLTGKYVVHQIGVVNLIIGSSFSQDMMVPDNAEKRGVISIHPHNRFKFSTMDYDIALMKMSYSVDLVKNIQLTKLPKKVGAPAVGTMCTVVGWGTKNHDSPESSMVLRKVDLPIVDHNLCSKAFRGGVVDDEICTLDNNKDACQGDSGGPLICNGVQSGIVSFGHGCGRAGVPGVYQRTDLYLDWINETERRTISGAQCCISQGIYPLFSAIGFLLTVRSCFI